MIIQCICNILHCSNVTLKEIGLINIFSLMDFHFTDTLSSHHGHRVMFLLSFKNSHCSITLAWKYWFFLVMKTVIFLVILQWVKMHLKFTCRIFFSLATFYFFAKILLVNLNFWRVCFSRKIRETTECFLRLSEQSKQNIYCWCVLVVFKFPRVTSKTMD